MDNNRIEIDVVLNDGSIAKGLIRAEREAGTSGRKIGNNLEAGVKRGAGRAFSGLNRTLVGLAASFAGAFATRALIEAASQQEDAINSLNQALKSAGTFSREASEDFQSFASQLQGRSIIGDEAILEAAALARNFTQTNEQAKQLTEAALELSSATGKDLTSSLEQLGKTFGGSLGRLAELVPDLKNLTTEQLKAGAATDFIINRFSGAALAKTKTFSGAVEQLKNTFGDLLEEFGFGITRSDFVVQNINRLNSTFQGFIETVKSFNFNEFISGLRQAIANGTEPFARGIRLASSAIILLFGQSAIGGLIALIPTVISGVVSAGVAFVTMARSITLARVGLNLFKASATLGLTLIIDQIVGLVVEVGSIGDAFEIIKLRAQQSFEAIRIAFLKVVSAIVNNPLSSLIFGDRSAEFTIDIELAENKIESLGAQIQGIRDNAAALNAETGSSTLGSSSSAPADSGSNPSAGGVVAPIASPEAFDLLTSQTEALKQFIIANQEFTNSNTDLIAKFAEDNELSDQIIGDTLESAQAKFATFQKSLSSLKAPIKKNVLDITNLVQNTLANGISGGIQNITNSLLNGENAFKNFASFTIGIVGDFMIRIGEMAIQVGIASEAVKKSFSNPAVAIAAGVALIALGTAFKSAVSAGPGGSSGSSSVGSATSGGGGVSTGQIGSTAEDPALNIGETQATGRQASIEVNIQGNVLDRRETALEIVQVLEEAKFAGIEVA